MSAFALGKLRVAQRGSRDTASEAEEVMPEKTLPGRWFSFSLKFLRSAIHSFKAQRKIWPCSLLTTLGKRPRSAGYNCKRCTTRSACRQRLLSGAIFDSLLALVCTNRLFSLGILRREKRSR